jgi:hypothetical protein
MGSVARLAAMIPRTVLDGLGKGAQSSVSSEDKAGQAVGRRDGPRDQPSHRGGWFLGIRWERMEGAQYRPIESRRGGQVCITGRHIQL